MTPTERQQHDQIVALRLALMEIRKIAAIAHGRLPGIVVVRVALGSITDRADEALKGQS